jgi:ATP-dependent DNA ligase
VVAGIAYKGTKFDGVYLGRRNEDELIYAGKVEHGFNAESEKALRQRAEKLKDNVQPLTTKIKKPKAQWLKPKLLVDVEYRALTGEGKLRHPSFKDCGKTFSHSVSSLSFPPIHAKPEPSATDGLCRRSWRRAEQVQRIRQRNGDSRRQKAC